MKTDTDKYVSIKLSELKEMIDHADRALNGDSNDEEHSALYDLREELAVWSTQEQIDRA